jgi:hypothetical protein
MSTFKRGCVLLLVILGSACTSQSGCFLAPSPLPAQTSTAIPTTTASTFSLSGQVTDSTNSIPISDATVSIADSSNAGRSATTDGSGNYAFAELQPAGFIVNVTATGYVTSSKGVTLTANQTLLFPLARVTTASTITVHGTVTDGTSGGVLPNVVVQITDGVNAGKSTRTGGTGDYNIGNVTVGGFEMSAAAVSYYTTTTQATVSAIDSRRDFVLERIPGPPPSPPPNAPGPGGGGGATTRYRIGAICVDGWISSATGSGACSSHGGVACWRYSDGTCTNP